MAGTNLAFSKVVATPTPTAWSQAYSAGSLFAAISLQTDLIPQTEEENLNSIGKDLISTLESEFFTLENKDLETIKQAILTTTSKLKETINTSFVICYLNENILYLYAQGGGKSVLKRGDKIGTVLEGEDPKNIKSASGYVQNGDVIVLQTKPFQRIISSSILASALDGSTPEEITEEIAPHVHDKSEGGASAVILSYKEGGVDAPAEVIPAATTVAVIQETNEETENQESTNLDENFPNEEDQEDDEEINSLEENLSEQNQTGNLNQSAPIQTLRTENMTDAPIQNPTPSNLPKPTEEVSSFITDRKPKKRFSLKGGRMSKSRKLILFIGLIIVVLVIVGSVFMLSNKKSAANQEQFTAILNEAKSKFDEGASLKELNASLSQESFKQAQAILLKNKDTFPEGSSEDKQIEELLIKVNSQIASSSTGTGETSTATEVDKTESKMLSYQIDNPNASFFAQNDDFVYFLDGKGINKIDKGNNKKESIVDKSWKTEGGIGVFGSNIYVLDKSAGIYKFVPSGTDYSKTNYFSGDVPDFSGTAAMGIDGSIYVLGTDGTITKFTKGAKDDFSITGLDKPLSSPTRITTNEDAKNVYILDKGNSRIVVLDKTGKFVKAYSADIIKNARDFDIQEAKNSIFVLSNDKIYKLDTK